MDLDILPIFNRYDFLTFLLSSNDDFSELKQFKNCGGIINGN